MRTKTRTRTKMILSRHKRPPHALRRCCTISAWTSTTRRPCPTSLCFHSLISRSPLIVRTVSHLQIRAPPLPLSSFLFTFQTLKSIFIVGCLGRRAAGRTWNPDFAGSFQIIIRSMLQRRDLYGRPGLGCITLKPYKTNSNIFFSSL